MRMQITIRRADDGLAFRIVPTASPAELAATAGQAIAEMLGELRTIDEAIIGTTIHIDLVDETEHTL